MTLAEIAVKLTANTAEFISGFGNAGVATKRFRADLSEHMSAIGGALDGALSQFGEFGSVIGQTLDSAAQAASRAVVSFGKLGGAAGTIAGVGAGAAAAILAVDAGAIALAIHTALATAELGELSTKTGVSTQTLAGLGVSARETGVPMESLGKALEFMNNNVVKAAIAPAATRTAFQRLGVDVRDTTGKIRESGAVFEDIVRKINALPQPEQGFFAKQIFGKGGAAILPLVNIDPERLIANQKLADQVGLGDPQTVQAAQKFKETVADIGTEFSGIALGLTKELLPAIQFVAGKIADAFKTGDAQEMIHVLGLLTKGVFVVADAFIAEGRLMVTFFEAIWNILSSGFKAISNAASAAFKLSEGDFAGAVQASKDGANALVTGGFALEKQWGDAKRTVGDTVSFMRGVTGAQLEPLKPAAPRTGTIDSSGERDTALEKIKARIEALSQEAANWAKVAASGTQAEQLIAEATKKSDEEFGKLKAEAAKSPAAVSLVIKDEALIKAAAAAGVFGKAISDTVGTLDKTRIKFDEQAKSALALAAAYQEGGAAIAAAAIDKQLEAQQREVDKLTEAYDIQKRKFDDYAASRAKLGGAAGPVQGENVPQSELELLKSGVDLATASLAKLKDQLSTVLAESLTADLAKQGAVIAVTKPYVDALNDSYLQGETSVRAARIELELYRFAQDQLAKGIVITTAQKGKERAIIEESDREAYQGALAQEAAQFSLNAQYDNQIVKLQRVREVLQQTGQSTLLIDAQLHDAQDRIIHQWDEAAFKVGTFGEKFKGVMGELVIQGRAASTAILQAFVTAIDGIETNLAKLLTGQKTNFKAVVQGLAEQVTKAEIQKGVGQLAERFPGLKTLLGTAKADGSQNSPFFVVIKNATPPSVPFGKDNPPTGFGIGSGEGEGPSQSGLAGLLSLFGGFRANGGDMSPGNWYIAGERGPEIVKGPGSVTPASTFSGGGGGDTIHNHFNYGNAAARDLFGRTEKQHAARHVRNLRLAH